MWLVNTGWTAGPYGQGHRIAIPHTRAMISAILEGSVPTEGLEPDPIFGVGVPRSLPGVPDDVLVPRDTWSDPAAYDAMAAKLAQMFRDNFAKFEDEATEGTRAAAPTPI